MDRPQATAPPATPCCPRHAAGGTGDCGAQFTPSWSSKKTESKLHASRRRGDPLTAADLAMLHAVRDGRAVTGPRVAQLTADGLLRIERGMLALTASGHRLAKETGTWSGDIWTPATPFLKEGVTT